MIRWYAQMRKFLLDIWFYTFAHLKRRLWRVNCTCKINQSWSFTNDRLPLSRFLQNGWETWLGTRSAKTNRSWLFLDISSGQIPHVFRRISISCSEYDFFVFATHATEQAVYFLVILPHRVRIFVVFQFFTAITTQLARILLMYRLSYKISYGSSFAIPISRPKLQSQLQKISISPLSVFFLSSKI